MKPLNAIARRARDQANQAVRDYFDQLLTMIAKQQGVDRWVDDVKLHETNIATLRQDLKQGRDTWAKMTLDRLVTDGRDAIDDAKEKAVIAAVQVLNEE